MRRVIQNKMSRERNEGPMYNLSKSLHSYTFLCVYVERLHIDLQIEMVLAGAWVCVFACISGPVGKEEPLSEQSQEDWDAESWRVTIFASEVPQYSSIHRTKGQRALTLLLVCWRWLIWLNGTDEEHPTCRRLKHRRKAPERWPDQNNSAACQSRTQTNYPQSPTTAGTGDGPLRLLQVNENDKREKKTCV